jgi:GDPmannose 4,6-dehydratase
VDPALIRPADVELLIADPSKARQILGWQPTVPFEELIHMIIDADLALLRKENGISE